MKNNKGLTLIELLAVIAIIGLLTAIIIPSYNTIKKKAANQTYLNKIELLKTAAYRYGMDNINDVKENPSNYENLTISFLIQEGYITSDEKSIDVLINPLTGYPMAELSTIVYTENKINVTISGGNNTEFVLTVDFGDGNETTQELSVGESLTLVEPTRQYYKFIGWNLANSTSTLNGNSFVMGAENATITAEWEFSAYYLTVTSNGGILDGTTSPVYNAGESVTINLPTRPYYEFTGWRRSDNGELITGSSFTMPDNNLTLTAEWDLSAYILAIITDGGIWDGTTPQTKDVNEIVELNVPLKPDYVTSGWRRSDNGELITGSSFTMPDNDLTLTAEWVIEVTNIPYTAPTASVPNPQRLFEVPADGWYKIEAWGAQGGNYNTTYIGGKGGYVSGEIQLHESEELVVYVGGTTTSTSGGYNGGGVGLKSSRGGGGATDIRYGTNDINNRIMVAAGGGGGGYLSGTDYCYGGEGGGLTGVRGRSKITNYNYNGTGATQTAGGYSGVSSSYGAGIFGTGGTGKIYNTDGLVYGGGGGGGGYYGGGGGYAYQDRIGSTSGGGGSSYISGHAGCVAIGESGPGTYRNGCTSSSTSADCSIHYSDKSFTNTTVLSGQSSMQSPTEQTEVGHSGNGYARITYMGTVQ